MISLLNFNRMEIILDTLSAERPIFYSEADFQHALSWAIRTELPHSNIRLEMPFSRLESSEYLDCLVIINDHSVAFELKYKTRELKIKAHNEQFSLKSQSAQDLGRYDFLRDLERIEHLVKNNQGWTGFAIFLTNDSSYWKPPGRPNISYRDFSMQEGRSVTGKLTWGATAGAGTTKGREQDIWLTHTYKLIWRNYSDFPKSGYSKFRYLALEVMRA